MKRILSVVLFLLLCLTVRPRTLERVAPETVGLCGEQFLYADKVIEEAIARQEIPGAVLAVVRHGKMAYLKAYGHRRLVPAKEPMTTGTIFDMASCSKPMGAGMALMKLVEQGRVRLLDPVKLYIPDFRDWQSADGEESVTIRVHHLLTHTSGLPPYAPVAELQAKSGTDNPGAVIRWIAQSRRDFRPGTDFQYSCLNYITLQHIVEQVSGMSLRQFTREQIFGPLEMDHTDYLPCKIDPSGRWINTDKPIWGTFNDIAPTELQKNGQVLCGQVHDPLARVMMGGISGNAGIFTTADDVAVLCAMLQNGGSWKGRRILSPLTVKAIRSVPREETAIGRTLGWDCYTAYASNNGDLLSPHTYGHTGYTGTSIVIDPDNDISIILLTNAVHPRDKGNTVRLRSCVANAVAAAIVPEDSAHKLKYSSHYYDKKAELMQQSAITSTDIIFLGDSHIEFGGDWSARLGNPHVRNFGIAGDEADGIYDRLAPILQGRPCKLLLAAGINDISHNLTSEEILGRIRRIVEAIRRESPHTEIYLQSLLPINESFGRWKLLTGKTEQVVELNSKLCRMAKEEQIRYVDVFDAFCEKGTHILQAQLSVDGLHLNDEGYALWTRLLKRKLL